MSWRWRCGPHPESDAPVGGEHPTQGEAETWLGESYPDLLNAGIRWVSLYDGDRLVYGPMSLESDAG